MKSKYEFKVVRSSVSLQSNVAIGFFDRINHQIRQEGENGWDYYKTIGLNGLVFRKVRQKDKSDHQG